MRGRPGKHPAQPRTPLSPCPSGVQRGLGGADQSSQRKSLYFLRTNGNKPLLVYFLVNCAHGGRGPGRGLRQLCPLGLIVPSSGLGSSGLWRLGSCFPEADPGGRGWTVAHAGKASAAREDRGRPRTQDRGAGAPGQEPGGARPQEGTPRLPPSPQLEGALLNLPAALGILGCGVRTLQVFPMTSPEGLSPGGGQPPPTPEPEPEPLSGRPPAGALLGSATSGLGQEPSQGSRPHASHPHPGSVQLELGLTLRSARTTSSGDFRPAVSPAAPGRGDIKADG